MINACDPKYRRRKTSEDDRKRRRKRNGNDGKTRLRMYGNKVDHGAYHIMYNRRGIQGVIIIPFRRYRHPSE
jgi:hypothetical protein